VNRSNGDVRETVLNLNSKTRGCCTVMAPSGGIWTARR